MMMCPHCCSRIAVAGVMLFAALLTACDATEPSPVREDTGIADPETTDATGDTPPTVAPPSNVEINGARNAEPWSAPEDHKRTTILGLTADKPATWIEHPPATSMELTRFTVPGRDGSPAAEIVVFYFGEGMGGSVEDNVTRWRNQFRPNDDGSPVETTVTEMSAGEEVDFTLVEIEGDWMRMGAASHTPDQQFVAAIVECPRGPMFIRFVGHKDTVGPNRDAFVDMLKSLRVQG